MLRLKTLAYVALAVAVAAGLFVTAGLLAPAALASSHREAPGITKMPKLDATDFYVFNSYEAGRTGYVTVIADYLPLQDPYGGPNYFTLDPDGAYDIKIDNDGDAVEDLTFRFRFKTERRDIALKIGAPGAQKNVAVPVINVGPISAGNDAALNVLETYTVDVIRGARRTRDLAPAEPVVISATGGRTFTKPVDNIGPKSIPDYASYAAQCVYDVRIPGCGQTGRVFVGQRKDPFVVNLGRTFDLVNIQNPLGDPKGGTDDLADKNVTALVLELPATCLVSGNDPVIGAWTTASIASERVVERGVELAGRAAARALPGSLVQVSRLSNPLVNEVVIGLKDKDRFNASEPADDAQFADYVTHPTLPAILELLFGVHAPTQFPRTDLVAAFLTGLDGLNHTKAVAEYIRLNTSTPAKPIEAQSNLGALGGDLSGFPNGRRPGDDVVDIALRVVMGALLPQDVAPSGNLPFTDGAYVDATFFDAHFPYLRTPLPGAR